MCVKYLGFVLLAWLPGFLHAQNLCNPPELPHGYFVPQQEKYDQGQTLTYSCDTGFKPVVEGWWATSTCQNGEWTHTPQCIDSSSCFPPAIENAKYEEAQRGSYNNDDTIKVACEDGFVMKSHSNRIQCSNGGWHPLLVCERSDNACDVPGKIPHAVIINQEPKEVYGHNTQLEYQCENGYTTGQAHNQRTITCQYGAWTGAQPCTPSTGPGSTNTHPTVTSSSCVLDLSRLNIGQTIQINMEDRETKTIECTKWKEHWMYAKCSNGKIEATSCCSRYTIDQNRCWFNSMQ
ncbi:complement factor H-related protein 2-like isoform X2 [Gambusia affinis]|uniref:complement factor H-related protein 2-like isoform X2 n=1 Tax=Gambusia affinis TaxID=33528 RepID=UPI001CDC2F8E|nr:complement factor H-related protein 2-like isoform X2 [Gambusia affinis]